MLCRAGQTLLLFYDQSYSQSPYRSGWRRDLVDRHNCLDDKESVLNSRSVCSLLLWLGFSSTLAESFALFMMSSETGSVWANDLALLEVLEQRQRLRLPSLCHHENVLMMDSGLLRLVPFLHKTDRVYFEQTF